MDEAIAAFVEGTLGDDERRALAAWVREDERHRERFVDQVRVHLGLATLLREDAGEQVLRRARLIAGSFTDDRQRQVIESARDIRPHRAPPRRHALPAITRWASAAVVMVMIGLLIASRLHDSHPAVPQPAPTPVAQVAVAGERAAIERDGHTRSALGSALMPGDVVMSGADERVELGFAEDATRIALRAGSRLEALGPPGKRFRLLEGTVAVSAAPQPAGQPMIISTPRADVTVVGTAFSVVSNPSMTWLDVEHGTVRFGAAGDQLTLQVGAGQRALATDSVRVVPPDRGTGLLGQYHDGDDFGRLKLVRVDPVVDFDWQDQAPDPSVERERFSVRWTGEIEPLYSEEYRFHVASDDGARLWIGGKLVIDNWRIQSANYQQPASGTIALSGHRKIPIRLDFFEHEHLAAVQLSWESRSQHREVVPQARLYPNPP